MACGRRFVFLDHPREWMTRHWLRVVPRKEGGRYHSYSEELVAGDVWQTLFVGGVEWDDEKVA